MSYVCDWCGEEIRSTDPERGVAKISASGLHEGLGLVCEFAGHFHAGRLEDDDSCLLQVMRLVVDNCKTSRPVTPREERARWETARKDAEARWTGLSRERRETLVLQVLGDERLIIREIADRMNRELGCPPAKGAYRATAVYETAVGSLVKRMTRDGQLERESETFNKTHLRYRYRRARGLDGPIAGLERLFHDDPKEA